MRKLTSFALSGLLMTSSLMAEDLSFLGLSAESSSTEIGQVTEAKKNKLSDHIITLAPDGSLRSSGEGSKTQMDIETILFEKFPQAMRKHAKRRIFLYAHGGLVKEAWGLSDAREYCERFLPKGVYPITFVWPTDVATIFGNNGKQLISKLMRNVGHPELDLARRVNKQKLSKLKLEAVDPKDQDKLIEDIAYYCSGTDVWQRMKKKAIAATSNPKGGAFLVAKYLAELKRQDPSIEIHISGHSAGSVFMGPFVDLLTREYGLTINTVQLRAPACTIDFFEKYYLPAIRCDKIDNFIVMNLTDEREREDGFEIYGKSILYLVSGGMEETRGEKILGMEKFFFQNETLKKLTHEQKIDYIACPNEKDPSTARRSAAKTHASFNKDDLTFKATLAQILNPKPIP